MKEMWDELKRRPDLDSIGSSPHPQPGPSHPRSPPQTVRDKKLNNPSLRVRKKHRKVKEKVARLQGKGSANDNDGDDDDDDDDDAKGEDEEDDAHMNRLKVISVGALFGSLCLMYRCIFRHAYDTS